MVDWATLTHTSVSTGNPAAGGIVRRQLEGHAIARDHADRPDPHLARNMSQHALSIIQPDGIHGIGKHLDDRAFHRESLALLTIT